MTSKRLTSLKEDILFDAAKLEEWDNDCQYLVALTERDIVILLSSLRYANWQSRWINYDTWSDVTWNTQRLEHCLMSGCEVSQLIDAIDGLSAKFTYNDQTVAQILTGMLPVPGNGVTLQEYLDGFEGDDIVQYPWMYAILTMLADILPGSMAEQYVLEDPAEFTLTIMRDLAELITDILQTAFGGVSASAQTGSAIADVAEPIVSSLDTIFSGVTAGALSLSAIIDLINLFTSGQTPESDTDEGLRALLRVYNNIFVEQQAMSVTQNNQQTVNCGGGCGGFGGGTGYYIAEENPANTSIDTPEYTQPDPATDPPPIGWPDWGGGEWGYFGYKCKAANVMTLGLVETMYKLADLRNGSFQASTYTVTARNIEAELRRWMVSEALLLVYYSPPPLASPMIDAPIVQAVRSWMAQSLANLFYPGVGVEDLDIFLLLRNDWITDRSDRVCDLYNSESSSEARTAILDQIDTYFADSKYSGYSALSKSGAKSLLDAAITNDWLDLLWKKSSGVEGYTDSGAIDCGDCGEGDHWDNCHGERFSDEDSPIEISSVVSCSNSYGCHAVHIFFDHDGTGYNDNPRQFKVSSSGSVSDCPGRAGPEIYFYSDEYGEYILQSATQDTDLPCNEFFILGDGPFTVTITFTEDV